MAGKHERAATDNERLKMGLSSLAEDDSAEELTSRSGVGWEIKVGLSVMAVLVGLLGYATYSKLVRSSPSGSETAKDAASSPRGARQAQSAGSISTVVEAEPEPAGTVADPAVVWTTSTERAAFDQANGSADSESPPSYMPKPAAPAKRYAGYGGTSSVDQGSETRQTDSAAAPLWSGGAGGASSSTGSGSAPSAYAAGLAAPLPASTNPVAAEPGPTSGQVAVATDSSGRSAGQTVWPPAYPPGGYAPLPTAPAGTANSRGEAVTSAADTSAAYGSGTYGIGFQAGGQQGLAPAAGGSQGYVAAPTYGSIGRRESALGGRTPSNGAPNTEPPASGASRPGASSGYGLYGATTVPPQPPATGTTAAANPYVSQTPSGYAHDGSGNSAATGSGNTAWASAAATSPSAQNGKYTVQPNDNFYVISRRLYGTGGYYRALAHHNRAKFPDIQRIPIGSQIDAPTAEELFQRYPQLCPKPSHREVARQRAEVAGRAQAAAGGRVYIVQQGDTLFDIAYYELGSRSRVAEIIALNRDVLATDINYLTPGMQLILPAAEPSEMVTQRPGTGPR